MKLHRFFAAALMLGTTAIFAQNTKENPMNSKRISAEVAPVFCVGEQPMTFMAWPTIAKIKDGTLVLGASGFRYTHVCPFGKSVIFKSKDNGKTWSKPAILNNSVLDDRDVGITPLPDGGYLVNWFTLDMRDYREWFQQNQPETWELWDGVVSQIKDDAAYAAHGSWLRKVGPDGKAEAPYLIDLSTPHGPVFCGDELFYIGWRFIQRNPDGTISEKYHNAEDNFKKFNTINRVEVHASKDCGKTWEKRYTFSIKPEDIEKYEFHEPTIVQTPSGRLLAEIRVEPGFQIWQAESDDRGYTWTEPHVVIPNGAPASVLVHSSGVLVMTYGYRTKPNGIHAAFSYDNGKTWDIDYILDDGYPNTDCGYPSSVELEDGSIVTAWYRQGGEKSGLWMARWKLPPR